jgi:hypothetical protein
MEGKLMFCNTMRRCGFILSLTTALCFSLSEAQVKADRKGSADDLKGIYSLPAGNQPVTDEIIRSPFIVGVSLRTTWRKLEPEEGKFQWNYLDESIAVAETANKKIMIRVLSGVHTPEWVYQKGAAKFNFIYRNPNHTRRGLPPYLPIPWDEIYVSQWIRFVDALGKRYNNHPAVVLIHMAGPTQTSAEMHLPKGRADKNNWGKEGYTKEKLTAVWKKVIDAYADAFPDPYLALNIATPIYNDGVVEEVVAYGYEKYGSRFVIQGNWLSGYTRDDFRHYHMIKQYSSRALVGFQMLAAASGQRDKNLQEDHKRNRGEKRSGPSRMGNLHQAIQKGLQAGASYFEIYQRDILSTRFEEEMRVLSLTLTQPR